VVEVRIVDLWFFVCSPSAFISFRIGKSEAKHKLASLWRRNMQKKPVERLGWGRFLGEEGLRGGGFFVCYNDG